MIDNQMTAAALLTASRWIALVMPVLTVAIAQAEENEPTKTQEPKISAREAVRQGNRFLEAGSPTKALIRYEEARGQQPDAYEIAFVEGLAHYDLKEFSQARGAFERATTSENDTLANDANYSLGTCDHVEAFQQEQDPKAAIGLLESALRRYQSVLERDPDHQAARDAIRKAATLRRRLRQQMQEQPQQQDSEQDQEGEQSEQKQDKQQQQDGEQDKDQESSDSQESFDEQQQSEQQEDQEQQRSEVDARQQEASREQAERKLRELMQAIKDRKKMRKPIAQPTPLKPVEKDW